MDGRKRFLQVVFDLGILMLLLPPSTACAEEAEASLFPASPLSAQLAAYVTNVQDPSTGLPESFTQTRDHRLERVAFTYDVATSALILAHAGKMKQAKQALSTFVRMPLPSAREFHFNTAYLIDQRRPALEARSHAGPILWIAIALMRYGEASGDRAAVKKGIALLDWAHTSLRHIDGGIVMSHQDNAWNYLMSVEHNWVYYAALRMATRRLPEGPQRQRLAQDQRAVRRWLGAHLTERGLSDPEQALDVYTHALLVGPESHLDDGAFATAEALASWARGHITALERQFQVPGSALYDYTDAKGARDAGRPRTGWLEGTEQVSVAYQTWAPWFERHGDAALARALRMKAALAHAEVLRYAARQSVGGMAVPNTNAAMAIHTFSDGWYARPRSEPALNGTTWTYFSEVSYNPLTADLPRRAR
ncbi:MAG: hypothetical protein HY737_04935 [Candidatus Omnitrophica bacterium]|nr:hypothetical protein [Candidatus Omnitrophota bacterium]